MVKEAIAREWKITALIWGCVTARAALCGAMVIRWGRCSEKRLPQMP
jgi:hypothetical protein